MKKFLGFVFLFLFFSFGFFAVSPVERIRETRIENGFSVFSLEDYSNPQVRIELCVRAGFSSQSIQDTGFFTLFSQLVKKSCRLSFESVEVSSDATRFILSVSPDEILSVFYQLSDAVFNANYSDSLLSAEWSKLKRDVLANARDSGNIINAGIDGKIFSAEPWRNDSGIYPALFSKLSENDARKTLYKIQESFFIPENAALFVSGNIQTDYIIPIVEETFGRFYSNKKNNYRPLVITNKTKKKYVIHVPDFSDDLTQVVIQYENLSEAENEMAAEIFNDDYSVLKNHLCNSKELNIPGNEYVNFSAASKSGSSRFIIQSLLQPVSEKNPVEQTTEFLNILRNYSSFSYEEYNEAVSKKSFSLSRRISSSTGYMEVLSEMWEREPYSEDILKITEKLKNKKAEIHNVSAERIISVLQNDEPFVFVILSSKQFKKFKQFFLEAGYEEINSSNASWYTDSLYKTVEDTNKIKKQENSSYVENFINVNKSTLSSITLSNGIPVFIKQNDQTTGVTLILSISGGSLKSADNHGFEEVMINLLTMNILRQIKKKQFEGLILDDFNIYSETGMDSSRIVIECETEDFYSIVNATAGSLILDEVIPSDADRIVQGRRTRKRLENGSTSNQLFSAAVNTLLPKSDYSKIYETQKEILTNTSYEQILQNYQNLLNADRYSIIISGNVNKEHTQTVVRDAFSVLQGQDSFRTSKGVDSKIKNFAYGKNKKVSLVHTFLTDIPAKDAGPMPAVLIPTKSFADPVLYCVNTPDYGTREFCLVNSVLPFIQDEMIRKADGRRNFENCRITITEATKYIPFAGFSFSSVEKAAACEGLYKEVIRELKDGLTNTTSSAQILKNVKTKYISKEFFDAYTNTGNAILIEESLRESENNPLYYLEKYTIVNNLTAEEILEVIEKYFDFDKTYRFISADSR
ncbi:MAG: insulinase family protein [Treponema sp.]|nr:insulinase family protein [Treponema sp.]